MNQTPQNLGYITEKRTVRWLIDNQNKLWIPHFQRGQVWGFDSERLLFDSIYREIPFGTIVFWEPPDNDFKRYGEPLISNKKQETGDYIIDGQQRIKSILDLFNFEIESDKVWCINVTRIINKDISRDGKKVDPLFMYIEDPRKTKNNRFKKNFIPIKDLETNKIPEDLIKDIQCGDKTHLKNEIIEKLEKENIYNSLLSREFSVYIIKNQDFTQAIKTYIRINTAGLKVTSEEKAFANLVSIENSDTNNNIKRIFELVHPEKQTNRDTILQKERESAFGFKLFLRTITQVISYTKSPKKFKQNDLGFDKLNKQLSNNLNQTSKQEWDGVWEITGEVLKYVKSVIEDRLLCDDLRFLPDATSLSPIFQLYLRFLVKSETNENDDLKDIIAGFILRIYLSNLNTKQTNELVDIINKSMNLNECINGIDSYLDKLEPSLSEILEKNMEIPMSIQNRYILMLYWILRNNVCDNNRCKDFSYEKNNIFPELWGKNAEFELKKSGYFKAEKQHIIPVSKISQEFNETDDEEIIRSGEHIVNNIGNITYISDKENGLKGLNNEYTNIEAEPLPNLKNHFIIEQEIIGQNKDVRSFEIVRLYYKIKEEENNRKIKFFEFCKARKELIKKAFIDWVKKWKIKTNLILINNRFKDITPAEPILKEVLKNKKENNNITLEELKQIAYKRKIEREYEILFYQLVTQKGCKPHTTKNNLEIKTKVGGGYKRPVTIVSVYPKENNKEGLYVEIKLDHLRVLGVKEEEVLKNFSLTERRKNKICAFIDYDKTQKLVDLIAPHLP